MIALTLVAAALLAQSAAEFENSYVRVRRVALEPRGALENQWQPQRLVIPLGPNYVRVTAGTAPATAMRRKAGDAVWYPAGDARVQNLAAEAFEALIIEFKGEAARPAARTRSPDATETVLIENDRVRVLRTKVAAHGKAANHKHASRLVIPLGEQRSRVSYPDGQAEERERHHGQIYWVTADEHATENLGDEPLESVIVEVKPAPLLADLQGISLRYDDEGAGDRTLVFVHGWTGDRSFWRTQIPVLSRNFRVVALDLPGHGDSEKPELRYTMSLFADAVAAVMRAAAVKRAVIVGHSMGVLVGRQFLRKYPAMAEGFIAVDGPFFRQEQLPAFTTFTAQFKSPGALQLRKTFVTSMFRPEIPKALRDDLLRRTLATPAAVAASAMEGMAEAGVHSADRITVPGLVIFAMPESANPGREAFVRSLFDKVDYQVWDNVSHLVMFDQPEKLNAAIRSFVDGLSTEPKPAPPPAP